MKKSRLSSGTKIEVLYPNSSGASIVLKSTFEKEIDDAAILISRPYYHNKVVEIGEFTKVTISGGQDIIYQIEGFVDEVVKSGVRTYWKVRKISDKSFINQRADIRYKSELPINILKTYSVFYNNNEKNMVSGVALDISNGGMAICLDSETQTGELLEILVPDCKRIKSFGLRGEVCWHREAQKGQKFRYIIGVHFLFDDRAEQERYTSYVSSVVRSQS